jgi:hypothetical protein
MWHFPLGFRLPLQRTSHNSATVTWQLKQQSSVEWIEISQHSLPLQYYFPTCNRLRILFTQMFVVLSTWYTSLATSCLAQWVSQTGLVNSAADRAADTVTDITTNIHMWPQYATVFKRGRNFLNSAPTSKESALKLLSAPSFWFWHQTAICPISLWALFFELHPLNWARAQAVRRRLTFLSSAPTSIESALRLRSTPSVRFWQQTAICPVSLRVLVVELHPLNWTGPKAVRRISDRVAMKELEEQHMCVICCKLGKNFTETFQLLNQAYARCAQ